LISPLSSLVQRNTKGPVQLFGEGIASINGRERGKHEKESSKIRSGPDLDESDKANSRL
jgi:hypothetical protein